MRSYCTERESSRKFVIRLAGLNARAQPAQAKASEGGFSSAMASSQPSEKLVAVAGGEERQHDNTHDGSKRGRPPARVDVERLKTMFGMPQSQAAKVLGISLTTLKQVCRRLGVSRWPYRRSCKANKAGLTHLHGGSSNASSTLISHRPAPYLAAPQPTRYLTPPSAVQAGMDHTAWMDRKGQHGGEADALKEPGPPAFSHKPQLPQAMRPSHQHGSNMVAVNLHDGSMGTLNFLADKAANIRSSQVAPHFASSDSRLGRSSMQEQTHEAGRTYNAARARGHDDMQEMALWSRLDAEESSHERNRQHAHLAAYHSPAPTSNSEPQAFPPFLPRSDLMGTEQIPTAWRAGDFRYLEDQRSMPDIPGNSSSSTDSVIHSRNFASSTSSFQFSGPSPQSRVGYSNHSIYAGPPPSAVGDGTWMSCHDFLMYGSSSSSSWRQQSPTF